MLLFLSLAMAQDFTADPKIINGTEASEEDYPMSGAIIIDAFLDLGSYGSGQLKMVLCSSTLIAPDVVMMAAHCVDETTLTSGMGTVEDMELRWTRQADLSDWDGSQYDNSWPDDAAAAWDWVGHPDFDIYRFGMGISENSDIALLFLEEPLDTPYAYLPSVEETDQLAEGDEVVIVGWGQQVATSGYQQPPPGTYAIKQMGTSWVGELGDAEFQVGPNTEDPRKCHGDSGGPTFKNISTTSAEAMRVIGVTSHSYDMTDCEETGGVDTRVIAYLDWIDAEMRERCEDGSRAWCETEGIIPPPAAPDSGGDTGALVDDEGEKIGIGQGCACNGTASPASMGGLLAGLGLLLRRARRA